MLKSKNEVARIEDKNICSAKPTVRVWIGKMKCRVEKKKISVEEVVVKMRIHTVLGNDYYWAWLVLPLRLVLIYLKGCMRRGCK